MRKLKILYRSFIPFLVMLIGLMVVIVVLDNYAEKISTQPDEILVISANVNPEVNGEHWMYSEDQSSQERSRILSDSVLIQSRIYYNQGMMQEAMEGFTLLSKKYPTSTLPYNYLGLIAMKKKQNKEAEKYFKKGLSIDSANVNLMNNLAIIHTRKQRFSQARNLYAQAKLYEPNNPRICFNLGLLYSRMQRPEKATQEFERCIELTSGDLRARSYCHLGKVQLMLSDTTRARENFEQAILYKPDYELARVYYALSLENTASQKAELEKLYRLNPGSFNANFQLGAIYEKEADLLKAEFHYKKALEKNPYDELIMEAMGNMYIEQGRLEEARMVLSGFNAEDTLPQSYFFEAKLAVHENRPEDAIQFYQKAVRTSDNEYPEAHLNLAVLHKNRKDYQKAIESYLNALSTRPDYAKAYYNLALLYADLDSMNLAIKYYRESIIRDPLAFKSWYNLGVLLKERGSYELAMDAFSHAIQIQPGYLRAMMAQGNLHLDLNELDDAIRTYRTLLSLYPNYAKGWFNLGLAYSRSERTEDAAETYEKVIEIDPENIRARINLGVMYARLDQFENAADVFEDAMDLDMANPDIRFNLALQYEKLGVTQKAEYQYYKAIELDQDYYKAYENLWDLYSEANDRVGLKIVEYYQMLLGDPEADTLYEIGKELHEMEEYDYAMLAYMQAKERGKEGKWIEYWIGKAYMDKTDFQPAIEQFHNVLQMDDEHKFAYYRLGQTYDFLGNRNQAEKYYSALLALDPEFKIVRKSVLEDE